MMQLLLVVEFLVRDSLKRFRLEFGCGPGFILDHYANSGPGKPWRKVDESVKVRSLNSGLVALDEAVWEKGIYSPKAVLHGVAVNIEATGLRWRLSTDAAREILSNVWEFSENSLEEWWEVLDEAFFAVFTDKFPRNIVGHGCWAVQFYGLGACCGCEFNGSPCCLGQEIVRTGTNNLGLDIPVFKSPLLK